MKCLIYLVGNIGCISARLTAILNTKAAKGCGPPHELGGGPPRLAQLSRLSLTDDTTFVCRMQMSSSWCFAECFTIFSLPFQRALEPYNIIYFFEFTQIA